MSELDDFLSKTIARQVEAEQAVHNGDPAPRMEMWSTLDPVTLFGAWGPCNSGWEEGSRIFRWVASRFSNCTDYSFDLVAAGVSGDLAYTVGYERCSVCVDGGPVEPSSLRVTHVYRRDNGQWKISTGMATTFPSIKALRPRRRRSQLRSRRGSARTMVSRPAADSGCRPPTGTATPAPATSVCTPAAGREYPAPPPTRR
jgi:ketosteroid isomerase-like protein